MTGDLYINGKDAWAEWGVFMDSTSLSALMSPPPTKNFPSNKSRLEDGTRYIVHYAKLAERDITLSLQFVADSEENFFERYSSFCEEISNGVVNIRTKHQPKTVYRCIYKSCGSYTQFAQRIAKVSLKLTEPDPTNRTEE